MKRNALLVLACLALLGAACDGAESDQPAATTTTVSATTTTLMPSLAAEPDESIDCPNFVPADEAVADLPSLREVRLYAPGGKISQHVFTNTADFGGARVIREPLRIEVSIKSNINENCWELRELVARKDTFHVVRVPHSLADVQQAAEAAAARGASTRPVQGQSVEALLPPSGEAAAAELHAEFGDMLELSVGGWSYPVPLESDDQALACKRVENVDGDIPGLRISAEPPDGPVYAVGDGWNIAAAGSAEATLRFENVGSERISFSLPQASLALSDGGDVVSIISGFVNVLQAPTIVLEPGEATERPALIGLTPCSVENGYGVAPGTYTARAVLSDGHGTVLGQLAESIKIDVVKAPSEPLPTQTVPSVTAPPTTLDQ